MVRGMTSDIHLCADSSRSWLRTICPPPPTSAEGFRNFGLSALRKQLGSSHFQAVKPGSARLGAAFWVAVKELTLNYQILGI